MRLLCLRKYPFSSFSRLTREVSEMAGGLLSRDLAVLSMADVPHEEAQGSWRMAPTSQNAGLLWQGVGQARHE